MIKYVFKNKKTGRKVYLQDEPQELLKNEDFEMIYSVKNGLIKNDKVVKKCIRQKKK